ncbi:hypothetical protein B0H13DRAFT_1865537 [Mycena leptocephala]|nr:hypothetical protein B0H13DRAFT_1865537 [Mycena leptocephala]
MLSAEFVRCAALQVWCLTSWLGVIEHPVWHCHKSCLDSSKKSLKLDSGECDAQAADLLDSSQTWSKVSEPKVVASEGRCRQHERKQQLGPASRCAQTTLSNTGELNLLPFLDTS